MRLLCAWVFYALPRAIDLSLSSLLSTRCLCLNDFKHLWGEMTHIWLRYREGSLSWAAAPGWAPSWALCLNKSFLNVHNSMSQWILYFKMNKHTKPRGKRLVCSHHTWLCPGLRLMSDLLLLCHLISSLHVSSALRVRRWNYKWWWFRFSIWKRTGTQIPDQQCASPRATAGEEPSAAGELPVPGHHVLQRCAHCVYFPEVLSLLILSKVRCQGSPRCFLSSSVFAVRSLQLVGANTCCCLARWWLMAVQSTPSVLVPVSVSASHSCLHFHWGISKLLRVTGKHVDPEIKGNWVYRCYINPFKKPRQKKTLPLCLWFILLLFESCVPKCRMW